LAGDPFVDRVVPVAALADLVDGLLGHDAPAVVLVDDADAVDDPDGALVRLLRDRSEHVHVVAAAAPDRVLSDYGHWTRELRRSRIGLALRPLAERDGELWHVSLPRHAPSPFGPGRGYLVHPDDVELVQVAASDDDGVALRRSA
jgi:S-DNA-T family DNA segregation ATPase FtsK/SpoIIIE